MKNSDLTKALSDYQLALSTVLTSTSKSSDQEVLNVLITRDQLQKVIQNEPNPDSEDLLKIVKLDNSLKEQASWITQKIDLEEWRKTFDPPTTSWWWCLEQPSHRLDRLDWLWRTLYIGCLTVAFSLVFNISSRFLSGGADTLGAFTISAQTLLTLLTAQGTLTSVGQQGVRRVLSRLNIPRYWLQEIELFLSFLLLLALFSLYSFLPKIAAYYRDSGFRDYEQGYLTNAQAHYQRALSLNPQDVETNFYLGILYEDINDIKQAKEEYQIASAAGYLPAYNNLARLYILEGKYRDATVLLEQQKQRYQEQETLIQQCKQLEQKKDKPDILVRECRKLKQELAQIDQEEGFKQEALNKELNYAYYKNVGWIQLQQDRLVLAHRNLEQAIQTNPDQAAAYCLLAQVLEKEGQPPTKTLIYWEKCLAFSSGFTPEETEWREIAQQRLTTDLSSPKSP